MNVIGETCAHIEKAPQFIRGFGVSRAVGAAARVSELVGVRACPFDRVSI